MAEELSRYTLECACRTCGTTALVRDWSCGCRTVSIINDRDRHYDCTRFSDMAYDCGESGSPRGHGRASGASRSRGGDGGDWSSRDSDDVSSSSSSDYSGGDDSLWGCLPLIILIGAVMMFAPRGGTPGAHSHQPQVAPAPAPVQSATGAPLRDAAVAERCSRAPYHGMIMPPGAPDWTEWFDVPAGCAVHMENGSDRLGSNLFVQCQSNGQSSRNACAGNYAAVRFQTRDWDMRRVEIIGFTMVPQDPANRFHWSEPPTDLLPGVRAAVEAPPEPIQDQAAGAGSPEGELADVSVQPGSDPPPDPELDN
jgi:hypothetical protein